MKGRKGEKTGWIGGWIGGFVWLLLLSIVWLVQGKIAYGIWGISLFTVAFILIVVLAPWKHPKTKYWKLMLPTYSVLIVSVSLYIWLEGGLKTLGLNWWSILWLAPLFIPFATIGTRCWNNGGARNAAPDR